jgi:hypothetical protein
MRGIFIPLLRNARKSICGQAARGPEEVDHKGAAPAMFGRCGGVAVLPRLDRTPLSSLAHSTAATHCTTGAGTSPTGTTVAHGRSAERDACHSLHQPDEIYLSGRNRTEP